MVKMMRIRVSSGGEKELSGVYSPFFPENIEKRG
jgi:hypothetical protein